MCSMATKDDNCELCIVFGKEMAVDIAAYTHEIGCFLERIATKPNLMAELKKATAVSEEIAVTC